MKSQVALQTLIGFALLAGSIWLRKSKPTKLTWARRCNQGLPMKAGGKFGKSNFPSQSAKRSSRLNTAAQDQIPIWIRLFRSAVHRAVCLELLQFIEASLLMHLHSWHRDLLLRLGWKPSLIPPFSPLLSKKKVNLRARKPNFQPLQASSFLFAQGSDALVWSAKY